MLSCRELLLGQYVATLVQIAPKPPTIWTQPLSLSITCVCEHQGPVKWHAVGQS